MCLHVITLYAKIRLEIKVNGGVEKMKNVNLNIRIDKETRDKFKKVADENAQNPSALVRKWIEQYIEEEMKDGKMTKIE